ncbi:hypothetical protein FA378_31120 [Pseudomonas aeruginosa]|uniref:hypothetical protein n=1 Tax=Pseudomonas aeruginosa TaxID=287 RepID=UPI003D2D59C7|nr:hypothetical protein [Pseudomonas aeruginosa]MCO2762789.1 hypothetical protein [Pseudomonas aeruginosa]MCO2768926.1 hypothetical protein [Pseudomonas aeruginosa]HBO5144363.1 hypothetical protein [Pseudomonas aeruginosa]
MAQWLGAIVVDRLTLNFRQIEASQFETQLSRRLLLQLAQQLEAWFGAAPALAPGELLRVQEGRL